jgi:hypothetical protein
VTESQTFTPRQYRKRPVIIEAMQYTVESCRALHDWIGYEHADHSEDCDMGINIDTLEGMMTVDVGAWVIKGVAGEFYPCRPDIFEATYEQV